MKKSSPKLNSSNRSISSDDEKREISKTESTLVDSSLLRSRVMEELVSGGGRGGGSGSRCGGNSDDFLCVKDDPPSEIFLSDEMLEEWTNRLDRDNRLLRLETDFLESHWRRSRGRTRDAWDAERRKTSLQEYEEMTAPGKVKPEDVCSFMHFKKERAMDQSAKAPPKRLSSVMSITSVTSKSSKMTGTSASSKVTPPSPPKAKLHFRDKLEIATQEIRLRRGGHQRFLSKQEAQLETVSAVIEERRIRLKRIAFYRRKFDKEILGIRPGNRRTELHLVSCKGESVAKYYDDVIRLKEHMAEIYRLSIAKSKRRLKEIAREFEFFEDNKVTAMDQEVLKISTTQKENTLTELDKVSQNLTRLLGECLFRLKGETRRMEEAEKEEARMRKEVRAMSDQAERLSTHQRQAEECRLALALETEINKKELEDYERPDSLQYVRVSEKVNNLKKEILMLERKIRITRGKLAQLVEKWERVR